MKSKLLMICTFLMSMEAYAVVGFHCKDLNKEIGREYVGNILTLTVKSLDTGAIDHNPRVILPEEQSTDAYQTRYGTYYDIMTTAQTLFPYMPETLMIYHLSRSNKLYRKGIKAFEEGTEAVELPKMYCKAFIEAINKY